jgi:hypothetical protein
MLSSLPQAAKKQADCKCRWTKCDFISIDEPSSGSLRLLATLAKGRAEKQNLEAKIMMNDSQLE